MAIPQLDLPARPAVRRQGRSGARPLPAALGWRAAGPRDFVVSADEKTSIQARIRIHPSLSGAPGRCTRIEHEYQRRGACAYLAAWDVHRAKLFGRCEDTTGIQPFDRLVEQVMSVEPYRSARRVFWITDNRSSHRGLKAASRVRAAWPSIVLVHTPVHASWLNQIEIYFSIVQRKVLTPNDFSSIAELQHHLLAFQEHHQHAARPFQWTFHTSATSSPASTIIRFALPPDPALGIRHRNCENAALRDVADVLWAPSPPIGSALVMGKPGVIIIISSHYGKQQPALWSLGNFCKSWLQRTIREMRRRRELQLKEEGTRGKI
jgi:DDE superfamily endonuclease